MAATTLLPATRARAAETPGVTATEIKIGNTNPHSGPASSYGVIATAEAAYFKMINDRGGVGGRKINFISLDDAYSPPRTLEQTRRLVEQEEVALVFNGLGTATQTAVRQYLNAKKIPQLFVATGADKFGDPQHFPWTMGFQPSYRTEATIYGKYLAAEKPGAKVAILYQNDDFGKDYLIGLKEGLGASSAKMVIKEVSYETTDPTIDSQAITLQASGADVLLTAATPKWAAQTIRKIADLNWKPLHFMTNVSVSVGSVINPAGPEKATGLITAAYQKDNSDQQWANDAGMNEWRAFMKQYQARCRPRGPEQRIRLQRSGDPGAGAEAVRRRSVAGQHHEAGRQPRRAGTAEHVAGGQGEHQRHQLPPDPLDATATLDRPGVAIVRLRHLGLMDAGTRPAAVPGPSPGDRLTAAALTAAIRLARSLSPTAASNLGGLVARSIGPLLPVSRVAAANLECAFPEMDAGARRRVLVGVWDNLGRTAAELPHIGALQRTAAGPGWECEDDSELRALRARGGPAILFSGHLANWEIGLPVAAALGLTVSWFYRAASNKLADAAIQDMRRTGMGADVPMFAKGAARAREALAHLRRGGMLGMLVDQKLNEGIAVPFFGRPAMTTPALAQFALRFRCPVIPIHPVRLGPARFRIVCEPPMTLPDTGDRAADIHALTAAANATLERWIREQPECWLWLHRRWPKDTP